MSERKGQYQGDRGPDLTPRKGSPRKGRRATGPTQPDQKPGRVRREKALARLVEGESPIKVAAEIGISKGIIYDWLKRPEFADELARRLEERDRALEAVVAKARRRLQAAAVEAADALVGMASGTITVEEPDDDRAFRAPRVDPGRVRAAEAVLNRIGLAASQGVTLSGGVDVALPDLRALTTDQLRALAGDDSTPTKR